MNDDNNIDNNLPEDLEPIKDNSELESSTSKIEGAGGSMTKSSDSTTSIQSESPIPVPQSPIPVPRIKLEPDLTPIYDESQYTLDPYGERITIEEYKQYYSDDDEEENGFNPFDDD